MIKLHLTCRACPEQYDAILDGKTVGYLRLRWGHFTVRCPDPSGVLVYEAEVENDSMFAEDERDYYLRFAVQAILRWVNDGYVPAPVKPPAPNVPYEIVSPEKGDDPA